MKGSEHRIESVGVSILGVGHHLPSRIVDNEELCRDLDVTPEWILEKTGIQRRYVASPDDSASDMAHRAAERALAMAEVSPDQVDLIVACTFSGDYLFPPVSAKIQALLGAHQAQIFDLQANCTGFVTGLTTASDRMRIDPEVRNALVIGVELCTRFIDGTDVNTAVYLSDGAGAAVLGRTDPGTGILSSAFFTDTSNYEAVRLRGGGSSFPSARPEHSPEIDHMEMNGVATWKQAITHLPTTMRRACEKAGIELTDLDFVVFHQANLRLIEYLAKKLRLGIEKTYTNVQEIGNTGSASLAIALSEAVSKGHLSSGDRVMLAAVGAGFNFGANVWNWTLPSPRGQR